MPPGPEYAGDLREVLLVYDQIDADYLFGEVAEILLQLPPEARVHFLVSRGKEKVARERAASLALAPTSFLVSEDPELWGDWGRDILQVVHHDGRRVVLVPYNKMARNRAQLVRGWEVLRGLAGPGGSTGGTDAAHVDTEPLAAPALARDASRPGRGSRGAAGGGLDSAGVGRDPAGTGRDSASAGTHGPLEVRLAPVVFEGGNLMLDRLGAESVLFVGHTALLETAELYRAWFERDIGFDGAIDLFRRAFGVDRVVPMGRKGPQGPEMQARLAFHLDMGIALLGPGLAVVAGFDIAPGEHAAHRAEVEEEVALNMRDETARRETAALLGKLGVEAEIPSSSGSVAALARTRAQEELQQLQEAATELRVHRDALRALGYTVHELETDWRHVRRYQSYTNVIAARDRLLLPIFPSLERTRARALPLPTGRTIIEVLADPRGDEYELRGPNLRAYELYNRLTGHVRLVRDHFYLASGNVHCVVGRLD